MGPGARMPSPYNPIDSTIPHPTTHPHKHHNQHKTQPTQDVVATGRKMLGATNPLASEPGTIRGDFSIDV